MFHAVDWSYSYCAAPRSRLSVAASPKDLAPCGSSVSAPIAIHAALARGSDTLGIRTPRPPTPYAPGAGEVACECFGGSVVGIGDEDAARALLLVCTPCLFGVSTALPLAGCAATRFAELVRELFFILCLAVVGSF
eukprot:scaffold781_cov394-Prasinococcus_capsulatus_cf.AAC.35